MGAKQPERLALKSVRDRRAPSLPALAADRLDNRVGAAEPAAREQRAHHAIYESRLDGAAQPALQGSAAIAAHRLPLMNIPRAYGLAGPGFGRAGGFGRGGDPGSP